MVNDITESEPKWVKVDALALEAAAQQTPVSSSEVRRSKGGNRKVVDGTIYVGLE
jgi:hypothetical protein